jgi:hypothetical protein
MIVTSDHRLNVSVNEKNWRVESSGKASLDGKKTP